jgi:DNA polymerase-3 subunit chi
MGSVRFYHLTRSPVDQTLARLLRRALDAGLRVEVRGGDAGRLAALDDRLWLVDDAEFLPHGRAGGDSDDRQPILLTQVPKAAPHTACVMVVDGAEMDAAEIARLDRTFVLFDGLDGDALAQARGQWKALTASGVHAEYWSEESGRWEKKAEAGNPHPAGESQSTVP